MTVFEVATIAVPTIAIIVGLAVPAIARHRKNRKDSIETEVVSWQGITAVLQSEKLELRGELRKQYEIHNTLIRSMDDDFARQLAVCRQRIIDLESQVAGLYRELYQARQSPP